MSTTAQHLGALSFFNRMGSRQDGIGSIMFTKGSRRRLQLGAAAIEFALSFLLFFVLFYAIVSYSLALLLQQSFLHAAEEGVRAALQVARSDFTSDADYMSNGVIPVVRTRVTEALSWLPPKAKQHVLGTGNGNIEVAVNGASGVLRVRVGYRGYVSDPLIPVLRFPVIGPVPKLPNDLTSMATTQL
jgi:Flp pilus assembly protein TadG